MMTVQAEKIAEKDGGEKAAEKPAARPLMEKRRALGRGLESLLPGPRAVAPSTQHQAHAPETSHQPPAASAQANEGAVAHPQGPVHRAGTPGPAGAARVRIPIPPEHAVDATSCDGLPIIEIALDQIDQNPHQTRTTFQPEELTDLADSIQSQGVIQPIVVRPAKEEGRYILILGERRLRASKMAGRATIPAVVRRVSEQQAAEMTLVENLQRQDLNCMDMAAAFRDLSQKFQMTQEQIGERVGVSRQKVANYMRLLRLPAKTVGYLQTGVLSYSHARELLTLEDDVTLEKMAERAVRDKLSVDKLEEILLDMRFHKQSADENASPQNRGARWVDPNVRAAQRNLETILGMKVHIRDRKGKGTIRIDYASLEDYDRVVGLLKGSK